MELTSRGVNFGLREKWSLIEAQMATQAFGLLEPLLCLVEEILFFRLSLFLRRMSLFMCLVVQNMNSLLSLRLRKQENKKQKGHLPEEELVERNFLPLSLSPHFLCKGIQFVLVLQYFIYLEFSMQVMPCLSWKNIEIGALTFVVLRLQNPHQSYLDSCGRCILKTCISKLTNSYVRRGVLKTCISRLTNSYLLYLIYKDRQSYRLAFLLQTLSFTSLLSQVLCLINNNYI